MLRALLPALLGLLLDTYRWSLTLPAFAQHPDSCLAVGLVPERQLARLEVWSRGRGAAWGDMLAVWWLAAAYPGLFGPDHVRWQWDQVRAEARWRRVEAHDVGGLEGRRVHLYAPADWVRMYVVTADSAGNVSCARDTVAVAHGQRVGP